MTPEKIIEESTADSEQKPAHGEIIMIQLHFRISFLLNKLIYLTSLIVGRDESDNDRESISDLIEQAVWCCEELKKINGNLICEELDIDHYSDQGIEIHASIHDIHNPLSTALGLLSLIPYLDPNDSADMFSRLKEQIKALYFAMAINGQLINPSSPTSVPLKYLIDKAQSRVRKMLSDKGKSVDISVHSDIDPNFLLRINLIRTYQIFRNLVRNAVDAGAYKIEILVDQQDEKFIRIRVRNNGVPISDELLPNIFQNGFTHSPDGLEKIFGGTGMGLTGAKYFLEQMKGYFGTTVARSELGGAEFSIYLPVAAS